ncbi:hypothetical protein K435DRAFT_874788 [Dendrothele bispora CBS 962.96]|uniref:Uncharacterized protein n=1 Tax=Dendrothele bispora (strain CBS 962.96) TaxID=1314807 RepID=A0A4S8KW70_DENBC|nr:hypothetical protein K435DRAFT_874788 [Dendrothele bispora CBS 962.96]
MANQPGDSNAQVPPSSITPTQQRECAEILATFHDAYQLVDIDLTCLTISLSSNPSPRPRPQIQETEEFCHYFALANMLIGAFRRFDYVYQSLLNSEHESFDELSNEELMEGSRSLIRWVNTVAYFLNTVHDLHQTHAAEIYCDDRLTMERSRIGDILFQQIIPVLRAQIFSVIRKGAKEEEIDSEDYSSTQEADTRAKDSRKMTPEEKHRSQRLKGTKEPALKHSTKYDHLPAQKWGAGSYVLVPVSSDPVSEAEESG